MTVYRLTYSSDPQEKTRITEWTLGSTVGAIVTWRYEFINPWLRQSTVEADNRGLLHWLDPTASTTTTGDGGAT
jgi:hypothetical protein